jgi:hypothetical protein
MSSRHAIEAGAWGYISKATLGMYLIPRWPNGSGSTTERQRLKLTKEYRDQYSRRKNADKIRVRLK